MKKSDLKDYMVVESKDGELRMVLGGRLLSKRGYLPLSSFNDKLEYISGAEDMKINKVYEINKDECISIHDLLNVDNLNLIWQREKEIDWAKVPFGTWVIVADHKEELNVDDGEYVMFVGYEPKLEKYPFIVTHSEKDYSSSYAYCMLDPDSEIKEEWYK
ncbi:TPA: hypothetical protein I9Z35_002889 [Clostridium perfringens]|nr:hypothetical protein [Clostridium perfringens]